MKTASIGIFGGTFDPIHKGHIHIAQQCLQQLNLSQLMMVPSRQSPQRTAPLASATDRFNMLKLAIANEDNIVASDIAIQRPAPSYAIDSLRILRSQHANKPLLLIIGQDVFNHFDEWLHWQTLFDYAHVVIVNRPDCKNSDEKWQRDLYQKRLTNTLKDLQKQPAGKIFQCHVEPYPVSATAIRNALKQKQADIAELDSKVHQYIIEHGLY